MEFVSGNIYIRERSKAFTESGDRVGGHTHNFDHTSIFFGGRWRVRSLKRAMQEDGTPVFGNDGKQLWILDKDITFDGPHYLLIAAEHRHEIEYLGNPVPPWMEKFLSKLTPDDAAEFRRLYGLTPNKNWCVYSHHTPQGDVVQIYSGWEPAYG